MTLAAPTTVNCTSCGAGLDVLGGGRVLVHVCPYCGAELDAQDDYKVIAKFEGMKRPDSPFRIGMNGAIHSTEYTVIGTLEYTEHWRGQTSRWVDHQLYSPTHGYAWLTLEDGHLVFTRRYRRPVWMSVKRVETADAPPTVRIDGQTYRYYETSDAKITFAEGEFTWAPRLGDKVTTVTAMSDDAMLGFSETGGEREVYRSTLLDREQTAAAFGVTDLPPAQGLHPLTPYSGPNDGFLRKVALICMVACVALAMLFDTRKNSVVDAPVVLTVQDIPTDLPITIPEARGPVRLTLEGTPHVTPTLTPPPRRPVYAIATFDLAQPDGSPLADREVRGRVMVGGQGRGQPAGNDNQVSVVFPPTMSGPYRLTLGWAVQGPPEANAAAGFQGSPSSARDLHFSEGTVTIRTLVDLSDGYWLYRLGLVFLAIVLFTFAKRWIHQMRRWQGSDWTSED